MSTFENVFRKILNGVFIVTTKKGDKINGMTAVWVARSSFKPPLVSVSVGKTRYSHDLIKESGVFALNILSKKQIAQGKHFGFKSGRNTDKFKDIEYTTRKTGSPILKDSAGYFDCKVVNSCDAGDHTIFVGEVLDAEAYEDKTPLLYEHKDFF
ncbi:MAG: flavin reductase [Thermodesulfovibrionia bacterium]|nr:flavin reductase [Thermodesulfovibrionia bacterium]